MCNFGRRHHEKQFCVILSWTSGSGDVVNRYFLSGALAALLFSGVELFV